MHKERDKYLTEAMGECWHEDFPVCIKCGVIYDITVWEEDRVDFSSAEGFFKLWSWVQVQSWFESFMCKYGSVSYVTFSGGKVDSMHLNTNLINPDRFANTVYEFLKE